MRHTPQTSSALAKTALMVVVACLIGCAGGPPARPSGNSFNTPTTVTGATPGTLYEEQTVAHSGPRARVAVMEFENKSGNYSYDGKAIGNGMKEQLITALAQTGAFIVLERDRIHDVLGEQDWAGSGRFNEETVADMGEMEGAEFLVYGAVTEYQPSEKKADSRVDRFRTPNDFVQAGWKAVSGAVTGMFNQDHVAIDIRLVDARTGRIVSATSVEGKARDLGGTIGGRYGDLGNHNAASYRTPMQKAVRACVIRAVNWIADHSLSDGVYRPNNAQQFQPQRFAPPGQQSSPAGGRAPMGSSPGSPRSESHANPAPEPFFRLTVKRADTAVFFTASDQAQSFATLNAGTTVEVLQTTPGWVHIQAHDGKLEGWVRRSSLN